MKAEARNTTSQPGLWISEIPYAISPPSSTGWIQRNQLKDSKVLEDEETTGWKEQFPNHYEADYQTLKPI